MFVVLFRYVFGGAITGAGPNYANYLMAAVSVPPVTFASSAYVPVATMPTWLRGFAEHQPVSVFVDSVRALLLGQPVGSTGWQALAWGLGILAVFIPLSVWMYGRRVGR